MDKINGYIKARIMAGGSYADCWQHVVDGEVVDYCNDDKKPVILPEPHEAFCLTGQVYFAPNVLHDPAKELFTRLPLFGDAPAALDLSVKG